MVLGVGNGEVGGGDVIGGGFVGDEFFLGFVVFVNDVYGVFLVYC